MKKYMWLSLTLSTLLACDKNKELPNPEIEPWKVAFPEITEPILDSRVNGEELHLITDNIFYRILGENILEIRPLSYDYYRSYSHPILGQHLIFRLLNHDTVAYLEFQPIKPGGTVKRISYDELGDDKLTFPITHGNGARHTGRFDYQNNFLFVGLDYPSIQQFTSLLKIDYDSTSNTIQDIHVANRINLNPNLSWDGYPYRAEDVFETDGVIFISAGNGGVYRYSNNVLDYFPSLFLNSVFSEGAEYYGADQSKTIIKSLDMGITWAATPSRLHEGWTLLKEGDFYIETTETNQLFRAGKDINELAPFSFPPYNEIPFNFVEIKYYDNSYLLYGNIEGKNQIFLRSTLN